MCSIHRVGRNSIYGKIKGLNTDSWLKIFVSTAIIGILLRFIIYEGSPFNVTSVENLGDRRLKQNLDKTKKETKSTNRTIPIYR